MLIELALVAALTQDATLPQPVVTPAPVTLSAGDLPWVRTPPVEYPARALSRRILRGEAVLQCAVAPDGAFSDCTVISETPEGMGFGQAALAGVRRARLDMGRWSEPVVRFRLGFAGMDVSN